VAFFLVIKTLVVMYLLAFSHTL